MRFSLVLASLVFLALTPDAIAGDSIGKRLSATFSSIKKAAVSRLCSVYDKRVFPRLLRDTTSWPARLVGRVARRARGVKPTVKGSQLIALTERIVHVEGVQAETQALAKLVEPGVRQAVCQLQRLGIETISSSANKKDLSRGYASISGDYAQLSETNRAVVDKYFGGPSEGRGDGPKRFHIKDKIDSQSTVADVHRKSIKAIRRFKSQTDTTIAGRRYSLDYLLGTIDYSPGDIKAMKPAEREALREEFVEYGYAWDKRSGFFYEDKETRTLANPSGRFRSSLRLLGRMLLEPPY